MPRVAGMQADEYIAQIAEYAQDQGWRVESTRNNRLKFMGPNGEGPVFAQLRTHSPRDVDNTLRQLIRAGLPERGDLSKPAKKEEAPASVLTVVKENPVTQAVEDKDELGDIIREYAAVNSKALDKLTASLNARLLELRRTRNDAAEWEALAQQQADAVEKLTAERDEALRKAEIAEAKFQALLAPMRAALAGE